MLPPVRLVLPVPKREQFMVDCCWVARWVSGLFYPSMELRLLLFARIELFRLKRSCKTW